MRAMVTWHMRSESCGWRTMLLLLLLEMMMLMTVVMIFWEVGDVGADEVVVLPLAFDDADDDDDDDDNDNHNNNNSKNEK